MNKSYSKVYSLPCMNGIVALATFLLVMGNSSIFAALADEPVQPKNTLSTPGKINGNGNGNGNKKNGNGNGKKKKGNGSVNMSCFACKELTDSADLQVVLGKPTLLFFYSNTCGACSMLKEPFNEFVQKNKDRVDSWIVNTGNAATKDLARLLKIDAVPSTIVIHKSAGGMEANAYLDELAMMTGLNSGMQIVPEAPAPMKTKATEQVEKEEARQQAKEKEEHPKVEFTEEKIDYGMTDEPLSVNPEEIREVPFELSEMDLKVSRS